MQLDGLTRDNAQTGLDESVKITPTVCTPAETLTIEPLEHRLTPKDMDYVSGLLDGLTVLPGDRIRCTLFGSKHADFVVKTATPAGPVQINPTTDLCVNEPKGKASPKRDGTGRVSYEDVGGLKPQLRRIRETIELPLRFPEVFDRLGIDAPKGVLLYGPPGTGKTLIARAIAHEVDAAFYTVSGPEVIHKFYGESEAALRKIWDEATKKAPAVIFIDELDSIAPNRENTQGEVEKRVVAQLLALMDGLKKRAGVMVIAATNLPNNIDPALRRPGRFDREIEIPIPDRNGRRHILDIHSRGMPLATGAGKSVDLDHLAAITHGCVGADLESLCREAAMASLRTIMGEIDFAQAAVPYDQLKKLEITNEHFLSALAEIQPSATREVFVEVPDVRWDDIGGLTDIKRTLVEAVEWPLQHAELFRSAAVKPPKGVLLAGPPGVGKTMIAKAVATESQANFISVKGPELISKFVGESEKGLREIFRKARQASPCIVFFDEIDALLPKRTAGDRGDPVGDRVLSQFLSELDGVEELRGVLILGATNQLDRLDPAVLRPGRFDEIIELGLPHAEARAEIFRVHLADRPIEDGIDPHQLAVESQNANGAQIAAACANAALAAVRRVVHMSREPRADAVRITAADINEALCVELQRSRGESR
ncbi:MAG: AAA family ATPase [Planctomycetota bacterium]